MHAEAFDAQGLLRCAWCATGDLYIQKDFPQGLGLFIVIMGFVVSTIFWYYEMPLSAYAVLLVSALLDMVLYYWVPDVTICYRCLSQYRGAEANAGSRFCALRSRHWRTLPTGTDEGRPTSAGSRSGRVEPKLPRRHL